MISSYIPGRVRLRAEAFRNEQTLGLVTQLLRSKAGVLSAAGNPRTGGILVEYDKEQISQADLLEAAKMLDARFGNTEAKQTRCSSLFSAPLLCRKDETRLLAASAVAMVAGAFISKRVHIAAAVLYGMGAVRHAWCRRKGLM